MKTKLLAFLALAVLCSAYAQGTLQFTAHLTSAETDGTGNGQFTLTGNDFTYDVRAPYTWNQGIIQAGPDLIAPIIFSLHLRQCGAPEPYPGTNRGGCFFTGNLTLSEGQISDLVDGQWYVRAFRERIEVVASSTEVLRSLMAKYRISRTISGTSPPLRSVRCAGRLFRYQSPPRSPSLDWLWVFL